MVTRGKTYLVAGGGSGLPEAARDSLGKTDPLPAAARQARGIRRARALRNRERDVQRRGDMPRRRDPDGPPLAETDRGVFR
jgi:hypothetical protein